MGHPGVPGAPAVGAVTLADWLRQAGGRIGRLDARLLLEEVTGLGHAALLSRADQPLDVDQRARLDALADRRAAGEPLAYLLGRADFRGLRLAVGPDVLVPRPETEELVDRVLALLEGRATAAVLDLGTGSGAIPLAIKHERPAWTVLAADVSAAALAVARGNAARLGLDVRFFESDWTGNLPAGLAVDCVVSNPPYVAAGDPHLDGDGVRCEPRIALTDFSDGLSCIRILVRDTPALLSSGGWLLMEHGYDQAGAVRELLRQAGFDDVQSWRDLAGIERMSGGRRP